MRCASRSARKGQSSTQSGADYLASSARLSRGWLTAGRSLSGATSGRGCRGGSDESHTAPDSVHFHILRRRVADGPHDERETKQARVPGVSQVLPITLATL